MTRHRAEDAVLVTGGAGFIGSNLVDRLVELGRAVLVIDNLATGFASNLPASVRLEELDVARDGLEQVIHAWRPRLVFHLAAQASVPLSIADPLRDLAVNVGGTLRLLAAIANTEASRFVFVSSGGAVYGERTRPATERASPSPGSPYGIHKLAAEQHVGGRGLPFAIARPSNVYGPRQSPGLEGAVVAAFLEQAVQHRRLTIHGDGRQTRDFIHVRDVVEALILLGSPAVPSGTWNVASGTSTSILELAALTASATGLSLDRTFGATRPGDVRHSRMSAARLGGLGWRPHTDLATGLADLVRRLGKSERVAIAPDETDPTSGRLTSSG